MAQMVLIAGTVVALSIGFTCLAVSLINAIRSSRDRTPLPQVRLIKCNAEDSEKFVALARNALIRGYDTPELYREDYFARLGRPTPDTPLL